MAGHSKWSNTKHRKTIKDNKKSKIFNKIIKNLVTISKLKGSNVNTNSNLRNAIDNALLNNMSRNIINRIIYKNNNNSNMLNATYEGYGPEGVAIIIECYSNNLNRTVSEIRHIFTQNGYQLSTQGSVNFLFYKKGIIKFLSNDNENNLLDIAFKIEAEDLIKESNNKNIFLIDKNKLNIAEKFLKSVNIKVLNSKITRIPFNKIKISKCSEEKLLNLIKMLNNLSDVKEIYHNSILLNSKNIKLI